MALEIIIWDVDHGSSTSVKLPNGKTIMIDCAYNRLSNFSPICQTKIRWGRLDLLVISHPHLDHISDIFNIDELRPSMLKNPEISSSQLYEGKYEESKEIIEKYIDFISGYELQEWTQNERDWSGEVVVRYFGLKGYQEDMNDYSLVTFITYGNFTFACAGDLTTDGWERLIKQERLQFTNMLKKTNFFQVSHHGRKEGYNPIIFDYMTNLEMAFISDKRLQTTSTTSSYSQHCKGKPILNKNYNEMKQRKVLTTRNDGRIKINVDADDTTKVSVETFDYKKNRY